jgi:FtsH-binding integral membrane protein
MSFNSLKYISRIGCFICVLVTFFPSFTELQLITAVLKRVIFPSVVFVAQQNTKSPVKVLGTRDSMKEFTRSVLMIL